MTGYFRVLNGHAYEGGYKANVDLKNGEFVQISNGKVVKTAAAKDTVFRVAGKTSLFGGNALVLDVVSIGTDEVYMVENEWDEQPINANTADYTVKKDEYVRMKRPLPGEQIILNVGATLYAAASVGDLVVPAADGALAAKA